MSIASRAVDRFAEQISVAAMPCVLLDHVDHRAPQRVLAGVGSPTLRSSNRVALVLLDDHGYTLDAVEEWIATTTARSVPRRDLTDSSSTSGSRST